MAKASSATTAANPGKSGSAKGEPRHAREIPEDVDDAALDRAAFRQLAGSADVADDDAADTLLGQDDDSAGGSPQAPGPEPEDDAIEGSAELGWAPVDDGPRRGAATQPAPAPAPTARTTDDGPERREAEAIARSAFQRDGWKGSRLDKLVASFTTEELLEQAQEVRDRQAEVDRLGNAVHNNGAGRGTTPAAANADPLADLSDLTPAQRKLVDRYRDLGDEETAILQVEEMRERNSSTRRPESNANPAARPTVQKTTAQIVDDLRVPLDRLTSIYPQLADSAQRAAVVERADRLIRAGVIDEHDSIATALERAASVEYGGPQSSQRAARHQHHRELSGQPTRTTLNAPAGAAQPVTEKDADRAAFRRLARGEDPKAVQAKHAQVKTRD